jgi:hypothetical protein
VSNRSRRLAAVAATALVVMAIASIAYAAGLANNTKSLPSVNPTGITANGADLRAWAMQIPSTKLGGSPNKVTMMYWGDPETTGGGSVAISKYTVKGDTGHVTITVKPGDTGMTMINCMATMSGGDVGAAVISSTSCKSGSYTVRVSFPGEQGKNPTLNMKWYTGLD